MVNITRLFFSGLVTLSVILTLLENLLKAAKIVSNLVVRVRLFIA